MHNPECVMGKKQAGLPEGWHICYDEEWIRFWQKTEPGLYWRSDPDMPFPSTCVPSVLFTINRRFIQRGSFGALDILNEDQLPEHLEQLNLLLEELQDETTTGSQGERQF